MQSKRWRHMGPLAGVMALGGLLALAPGVGADEITDDFEVPVPAERPAPRPAPPPAAECPDCPPNKGKVSFNVGIDIPTRYYFRGILQEDEGFIGQPYAEVNFNLFENDMMSATAIGGIWNSIHSEHTKITGGSRSREAAKALGVSQRTLNPGFGQPEAWYEFDAYGGLALGVSDFEVSTIWTTYLSPSGAFDEVNDVAFGLGYDDSDLLGDFALNPGVTFYLETKGAADGVRGRGTMLQLHGGPEFGLTGGDNPVTLTIPLELGLSLDDYYQDVDDGNDSTFGYFQTGVDFGFPLTFIPCEYGNWLLNAGGRFISLGRSLKEVNRHGDDYSFFGMFGLSMTY